MTGHSKTDAFSIFPPFPPSLGSFPPPPLVWIALLSLFFYFFLFLFCRGPTHRRRRRPVRPLAECLLHTQVMTAAAVLTGSPVVSLSPLHPSSKPPHNLLTGPPLISLSPCVSTSLSLSRSFVLWLLTFLLEHLPPRVREHYARTDVATRTSSGPTR